MKRPVVHGTTSGYSYHKCRCDECKAANNARARRWREDNPEKFAASLRRYREANPEKVAERERRWREANSERNAENLRRRRAANPEKKLEWDRRWREANREKTLESGRRWREANPGKATQYVRAWQEANPERSAELNRLRGHRYRARKRDGFIEDVPRLEIFELDKWQCQIPGCLYPNQLASLDVPWPDPLYATIDHVTPLSKDGKHQRSNLVTAHFQCNRAKGARAGIGSLTSEEVVNQNGSQL